MRSVLLVKVGRELEVYFMANRCYNIVVTASSAATWHYQRTLWSPFFNPWRTRGMLIFYREIPLVLFSPFFILSCLEILSSRCKLWLCIGCRAYRSQEKLFAFSKDNKITYQYNWSYNDYRWCTTRYYIGTFDKRWSAKNYKPKHGPTYIHNIIFGV